MSAVHDDNLPEQDGPVPVKEIEAEPEPDPGQATEWPEDLMHAHEPPAQAAPLLGEGHPMDLQEAGLTSQGPVSRLFRVLRQVRRRWRINRCSQASSSLAFQTALSLVALVPAGLALLKATGSLDARSAPLGRLARTLLPLSAESHGELTERVSQIATHFSTWLLGGLGLLLAIAIGFNLFLHTEATWNEIWSTSHRRSLFGRFLLFNTSLTLLPAPLLLATYYSLGLFHEIGALGLGASFLVTAVTLVALNRVLPAARVEWRAALFGGLVSALLVEAARLGMTLYVARLVLSNASVYSVLGLLPLSLLFLHLIWLAVLLGAELSHATQHLTDLEADARASEREGDEEGGVLISDELILRLLGDIAYHYAGGGKALGASVLRQRHALPERVLRQILSRMESRDLIIAVDDAYLPARPLERVHLDEVLHAFRLTGPVEEERLDRLSQMLREVRQKTHEQLMKRTLADIV